MSAPHGAGRVYSRTRARRPSRSSSCAAMVGIEFEDSAAFLDEIPRHTRTSTRSWPMPPISSRSATPCARSSTSRAPDEGSPRAGRPTHQTSSVPARRTASRLFHRAGEHTLLEVALEREEHAEGDDEREEGSRREDVDVRAELTGLGLQRDGERADRESRTSAMSMSFHTHRNWKMPSEAIAGRPSGRMTEEDAPSPAPSSRAASSNSWGSQRRSCAAGTRRTAARRRRGRG